MKNLTGMEKFVSLLILLVLAWIIVQELSPVPNPTQVITDNTSTSPSTGPTDGGAATAPVISSVAPQPVNQEVTSQNQKVEPWPRTDYEFLDNGQCIYNGKTYDINQCNKIPLEISLNRFRRNHVIFNPDAGNCRSNEIVYDKAQCDVMLADEMTALKNKKAFEQTEEGQRQKQTECITLASSFREAARARDLGTSPQTTFLYVQSILQKYPNVTPEVIVRNVYYLPDYALAGGFPLFKQDYDLCMNDGGL